jgi:TRAP-type uncharacterized transport system substrate-binding protein
MNIKTIIVIAITFVFLTILGLTLLVPAPPKLIKIAAGVEDGSGFLTANRIKNQVEKNGIKFEIIATQGNLENMQLIEKKDANVSLAIVPSGLFKPEDHPNLESIANLYLTPLLIIYRKASFNKPPEFIRHLNHKKISIGPAEGNASLLFKRSINLGSAKNNFDLSTVVDWDISKSLFEMQRGKLDAVVIVERPDEEEEIMAALKNPDFGIFNMVKAAAYPSRIKSSKVVEIPRATFSLQTDSPPADIQTIGVSAELIADKGINPAITSLILGIITKTESSRSILQNEKDYPNARELTFDQNEDSARYFRNGPSLLNKYLPFWVAVWGDRLLKILLPILAILIPVVNFYPEIGKFRTKKKLARNL